jgi:hypothetical protein
MRNGQRAGGARVGGRACLPVIVVLTGRFAADGATAQPPPNMRAAVAGAIHRKAWAAELVARRQAARQGGEGRQ